MKKLLIIGQVPKEYGGNYTTGVANVIIELGLQLSKELAVYIYGTNLNARIQSPIEDIRFLGYSNKLILRLFFYHMLTRPLGVFKECWHYSIRYGLPPIKYLAYRLLIEFYIKKIKPDYINAHGMIFTPIMKQLKLENAVLFSFHGFMHDDPASIIANKKRGINMDKLYKNGSRLVKKSIYLTDDMRHKGINNLNIPKKDTFIIPNGVSTAKFYYDPEYRKSIRKKFNIGNDSLVFISVGALTRRKNHLGFIEFLERNNIKSHYWIIGKAIGQEKETMLQLKKASKDSLFVQVSIISYVPHDFLFQYYSAADIYAHPSTSEGQALVALEALCCGLPLIVNSSIKETLGLNTSFSEYVQMVDLNEGKMLNMNIPDRILLSSKCRKELSWKASARKYLDVFHGVYSN